jgi:hypothetical protein
MPATTDEYVERLHMSWWWWLILGLFALSLVVAVLAWIPTLTAVGICLVFCGLVVWAGLAVGGTRIRADAEALEVGRNRIEWRWLDRVRGCDAETMTTVLHSSHQIGSFLVTRPWISTGVVLRLADPADPHPAWIISSRHPDRLAAVVRGHLDTSTSQETP